MAKLKIGKKELIFLGVLGAGGVGYWLWQRSQNAANVETVEEIVPVSQTIYVPPATGGQRAIVTNPEGQIIAPVAPPPDKSREQPQPPPPPTPPRMDRPQPMLPMPIVSKPPPVSPSLTERLYSDMRSV